MLKCDHCLLPFHEKDAVPDDTAGEEKVFCCSGCRCIYMLIRQEGLDRFYSTRKWEEAGIAGRPESEIDTAPFAEHVKEAGDLREIDISIDGIRCASCVWLNEKVLGRTEGIEYARVNYATHRARIRWDPARIDLEGILRRVRAIGYIAKPFTGGEQSRRRKAEFRDLLVRFGTAGFLSSQIMIYSAALYAGYFQGMSERTKFMFEVISLLLSLPVLFYSGRPFISGALRGLKGLHFNMDSLIALGAGSAFIYSIYEMFRGGEVYFDTVIMIITLILLGRLIEATAKGKASEAIERLAELAPREARVVYPDGERRRLSIGLIDKGDIVEVVPGERIPLDGIVKSGGSEVDESILTGEAMPVTKTEGSEVIGGTMNLYGSMTFEVTRTGKDTVLAGIIKTVEDAQASKPGIQTTADKVVGYFVPSVLALAVVTVAVHLFRGIPANSALMSGISVLVIACPCSLGLATPLAVLMFTSLASSKGILIKGGEVVERVNKITDVVFDKTGTITLGRPVLKEAIIFDPSLDKNYILRLAAAIEGLSEHSLGHAITAAAAGISTEAGMPAVSDFRAVPGRGVEGTVMEKKVCIGNTGMMCECGVLMQAMVAAAERANVFESAGDTVIYAAWDGTLKAMFVVSDVIREEAPAAVGELKKLSCRPSIVSGDNAATTGSVSSKAGILEVMSGLSPSGKKEVLEDMQQKGSRAMMVGDGINDAPALAQADVGMAMGKGTDIAIESADAVLLNNDLSLIPYCIRLSRKTFDIIKQNIFWAFFYNIVAIPLAISGVLHPVAAAGAMAASSLFVVGNSLRIKRFV